MKIFAVTVEERCKLYCRALNTNSYYKLSEKVVDGTICGPDSFDICVNGVCRLAGCDRQLGSTRQLGMFVYYRIFYYSQSLPIWRPAPNIGATKLSSCEQIPEEGSISSVIGEGTGLGIVGQNRFLKRVLPANWKVNLNFRCCLLT